MNLIEMIKGVFKSMFNKNNLETVYGIDIAMTDKLQEAITTWSYVYENKAPWLSEEIKSLNLGSAIANEFSRLILDEFESEITGSARADYLNDIYKKVLNNLPNNLEFANAKGGLIIKPYIKGNTIAFDFIQQGYFFPTEFDDSGNITGCIFLSQKVKGNFIFTRLEYHSFQNENYVIQNKAFKSNVKSSLGAEISLSAIPEWAEIQPISIIQNLEKPLFAYYKTPMANFIDSKSPIGISVYAKSINLIKDADIQYDRALWEYEASEKAIFASDSVLKPKQQVIIDGNKKRTVWETPKLNQRLFKGLDITGKEESELLKDYSPEIREEFWTGLNKILERIEFNCCLAYGTLSEPTESDKTATEIKASKQRSYTTVSRMQNNLQIALDDLIYAIDSLTTLYGLAPQGNYETSYSWGDSVLTDTQTETAIQIQEVNAGLRSKLKYIMWRYGLKEEQAKEELQQIENEKRK